MKILFFIILLFSLNVVAQKTTPKPEAAVKNTVLESLKKQRQDADEQLKQLRAKFTEEYPAVRELKLQIAKIDEQIQKVILTDKTVELTPDILPNDSVFLLKLIIIQNQEIIKLLQQKK
jgi:uncharacterized protein involved in exopolysaccharide biosynthesis